MSVSVRTIVVRREVLGDALARAAAFRDRRRQAGTLVVNLISSPGAGKTSLLEALARDWPTARLAALVGDLATDRDARRLARHMPCVQLSTGGTCHLEIDFVERGWEALGDVAAEVLFVENVGNLVCPAAFDLGEHVRVLVLSTPEGDDKPAKYPKAVQTSRLLVINKIDLLPHVPFSPEAAARDARAIQPQLDVLNVSALSGEGIAALRGWLVARRQALLEGRDEDR